MNQAKVNRIISYIKAQDEFPFDVFDIDDQESVLGYFGFHPELDDEERKSIQQELMEIAGATQSAEMARLMCAEPVPIGLYRTRYCTRIERALEYEEYDDWKNELLEKVRGSPAIPN